VSEKKIRVLMTKTGLDGHDRGAKVVAATLRDAGMEVIYAGRFQSPEQIVETALQEDVDVIGVSCLSASYMVLIPELIGKLKERGLDYIPVILGGVIAEEDYKTLLDLGVKKIFGPGSSIKEIIDYVKSLIPTQHFSEGFLNSSTYTINLCDLEAKEEPSAFRKEVFAPPKTKRIVFGWGLCKPQHTIAEHWHDNMEEVIYILKGSGILIVGGKEFQVKPGQVTYVPRGVHHVLINPNDETIELIYARAISE